MNSLYISMLAPYLASERLVVPATTGGSRSPAIPAARARARARELFVLRLFDADPTHIYREYGIPQPVMDRVLDAYQKERSRFLAPFQLGDLEEEVLLGQELLARIKMTDRHLLRHLVDLGFVAVHRVETPKQTSFPLRSSVGAYLGTAADEVVYTTKDAANECGCPVKTVDRIARREGIGRKVKPDHSNSSYLLTRNEVEAIRENVHRTAA